MAAFTGGDTSRGNSSTVVSFGMLMTDFMTGARAALNDFARAVAIFNSHFDPPVFVVARLPRLDFTLAQRWWFPAPQFSERAQDVAPRQQCHPRGRAPRRRPLRARQRAVARLARLRGAL
jgi:hypothetical protein